MPRRGTFFSNQVKFNPPASPALSGPSLSLTEARKTILARLTPLSPETISLEQGLGRVPVNSLTSTRPKPSFDQSTRDGYAIAQSPQAKSTETSFPLIAEIAAGSTDSISLAKGQAVRIMTGARIPTGTDRVVPFETCREEANHVIISARSLQSPYTFIRRRGRDLKTGRVIAGSGKILLSDHLLMLAENGYINIPVHRKPRVVILCTGSELVTPGQSLKRGQKISGNGVLLQGLLQEAGGECIQVTTVSDNIEAITEQLNRLLSLAPDLIVTTGGMGPGKFDLLEQVFSRLHGQLFYNSLKVRPGKSTMFGLLAGVAFFGLPGPPPAVRLLFHELVTVALYRLQGMRQPVPPLHKARLLEPVTGGGSRHLNLKGGVVVFNETTLCVRLAGRLDGVGAVLHLRGRKRSLAAGETVNIRLVAPHRGC